MGNWAALSDSSIKSKPQGHASFQLDGTIPISVWHFNSPAKEISKSNFMEPVK